MVILSLSLKGLIQLLPVNYNPIQCCITNNWITGKAAAKNTFLITLTHNDIEQDGLDRIVTLENRNGIDS